MVSNFLFTVCSWIGAFGPPATVVIAMGYIVDEGLDRPGLFLLALWQPLNICLNEVLKWVIDEERPTRGQYVNDFEKLLELGNQRRLGMPSGHAQMIASTFTMAVVMNLPMWVITVTSIQIIVTLWQRYRYRKHTILQLAFGLLAGSMYSLFFSNFLKKHLTRNSLKLNQ